MYFRFATALFFVVLISMAGVALEKRTLELHREVSRQYYRTDVLLETHARLRLKTQRLSAPARLFETLLESDERYLRPVPLPEGTRHRAEGNSLELPVLRWKRDWP